jgi:hypothetical protein
MARKAQPKLVRFEDGVYWFAAKLAAEKSGLTKPELARRALAGKINHKTDKFGNPTWYAQPDIEPLREAHLAKEMAKTPRKAPKKSLAALEKQWARDAQADIRHSRGQGPLGVHADKVLLWNLNRKPKASE